MSTYRRYSEEFKAEAIAFVSSSGLSVAKAAEDLGMSQTTLYCFVTQSDIDVGAKEGLTTDERKRLMRLERENRILKEEREILKKTAAAPLRTRSAPIARTRRLPSQRLAST